VERSPLNLRFHLPPPLTRRSYYLTIIGGGDFRNDSERELYPIRTFANGIFIVGVATSLFLMALLGIALQTATLEFQRKFKLS